MHLLSILMGQPKLQNVLISSKIPAAINLNGPEGKPISLFEGASIMLYLTEKHGRFVPKDVRGRTECMNWLFWQMAGQGPMNGNFGHFMAYAPAELDRDYGVARYGMEVQRLCSVPDTYFKDLFLEWPRPVSQVPT